MEAKDYEFSWFENDGERDGKRRLNQRENAWRLFWLVSSLFIRESSDSDDLSGIEERTKTQSNTLTSS